MLALPDVTELYAYPIPAYPTNPPPPLPKGLRSVEFHSAFIGADVRVDYSIDDAAHYQFGTLAEAIIPEAVFVQGTDGATFDISQHLRDSVIDVLAGEVDSVLRMPEAA